MDKNRTNLGIWIVVAAVIVGIAIAIWAITAGQPTDRESLLLSIVLTVLSSVGSWITSSYYAEYSSSKNLRVFALKAAEKVTNLSNELDRLSVFLQQELEDEDFETPNQSLLSRDSRIEGAIHVINTLKSMNDKSLSDWQGVIGDEIVARQEKQEEREEELREVIDKLEALYETDILGPATERYEEAHAIRAEMEVLKSDVRMMASLISGVPIKRKKVSVPVEQIEARCPHCSIPIRYQQKPKPNGYKGLICGHCNSNLISRYIDGKFTLDLRNPRTENISCPGCSEALEAQLDPMPGSAIVINCSKCNSRIRVYRTSTDVGVKLLPEDFIVTAVPISEEFLQQVREALPPQPWPKGAAKEAAAKLRVSVASVSKAIEELIRREIYKPQFDGELYVREKTQK